MTSVCRTIRVRDSCSYGEPCIYQINLATDACKQVYAGMTLEEYAAAHKAGLGAGECAEYLSRADIDTPQNSGADTDQTNDTGSIQDNPANTQEAGGSGWVMILIAAIIFCLLYVFGSQTSYQLQLTSPLLILTMAGTICPNAITRKNTPRSAAI